MGTLTYSTQEVQDRLDAVGTFVRPNLLDNAYFIGGGSQQGNGQFPINQRGSTSYSTTGNTIDRWYTSHLSSYGTAAVNSGGIKITHPENGGYMNVVQSIEDVQRINGKQVTVSAIIDGVLYSETYTVGQTGDVTWGNLEFVKKNPGSNASGHVFTLRVYNTTGATIQAVKLELGDTQTLAHQESGVWVLNEIPNFEESLARCQRFYQTYRTQSLRPTYAADCRPVMRTDPSQSTITVASTTYYTNSADL